MPKVLKTYGEKLKDPRWQKKRLEVLQRDDFKCLICGDTESQLHVHHHVYAKGGDPLDIDGLYLSTLCDDCHKVCHIKESCTQLENELIANLQSTAASWPDNEVAKEVIQLINKIVLAHKS